jgi:hypothetical protein
LLHELLPITCNWLEFILLVHRRNNDNTVVNTA